MRLADIVQKYRNLYDYNWSFAKTTSWGRGAITYAWEKVATEHGHWNAAECKAKFKNMRDAYGRWKASRKNRPSGSAAPAEVDETDENGYFNRLGFLDSVRAQTNSTSSNIPKSVVTQKEKEQIHDRSSILRSLGLPTDEAENEENLPDNHQNKRSKRSSKFLKRCEVLRSALQKDKTAPQLPQPDELEAFFMFVKPRLQQFNKKTQRK